MARARPAPDRGTKVPMIRVFLLDDHEVVRAGVRDMLQRDGDIEVIGESRSAVEATHRIPASRPDVAVLDARLPDGNGIDAAGRCLGRPLDPGPDPHLLRGRRGLFAAIMAGRLRVRPQADPRPTWSTRPGESPVDSPCWTRPSPNGYWSASATAWTNRPTEVPDRTGAAHPGPRRRGPDQPGDRGQDVPGREDGQELRLQPAGEAGPGAAHPGGRPRPQLLGEGRTG